MQMLMQTTPTEAPPKRAPTLYGIIVFKLLKGALFLTLAITVYTLSDNDLPREFARLMRWLKVHPGNQFFSMLATRVGQLTEANMLWAAAGTFFYSLFSLVEGVGLIFRVSWAGWLAIGESVFFIPIELYDLLRNFSWTIFGVLAINIIIAVYLLRNRDRLFRHHRHH